MLLLEDQKMHSQKRKSKIPTPISHAGVKVKATTMLKSKPMTNFVNQELLHRVTPGSIIWLPAKDHLLNGSKVDARLHVNAFDHPAVILCVPRPLKLGSLVEIAVMTSCGSRTLRQAAKLPHRSQLLRVKTAAHPYAKVDLNLKNGRGMAREHSYVSLQKYLVELRTLGLYQRQLGELSFTSQSLKKLLTRIGETKQGKQNQFKNETRVVPVAGEHLKSDNDRRTSNIK